MKERLLEFLKAEDITATRLADKIGVQRSSISHIISGRNKPSYDFIEKILLKFPDLNPDWLILGKGGMFKSTGKKTPPDQSNDRIGDRNLFDQYLNENREPIKNKKHENEHEKSVFTNVNSRGEVEKLVIFYTDGTFKEYIPRD